jgi:hypothetical protein
MKKNVEPPKAATNAQHLSPWIEHAERDADTPETPPTKGAHPSITDMCAEWPMYAARFVQGIETKATRQFSIQEAVVFYKRANAFVNRSNLLARRTLDYFPRGGKSRDIRRFLDHPNPAHLAKAKAAIEMLLDAEERQPKVKPVAGRRRRRPAFNAAPPGSGSRRKPTAGQ